ncbi:MAG: prepilin-type N-terminal cleavage/methylation domain-containing protein [Planctomycetota bacterium]|nr:MAG: prepilin-type N-terminal cleavage/methylation domain-containing protein [Planctomycetota bacterium]
MRRARSRNAFTLIEVLLTTVLAAVLLVALWSLLSMYSKAFESGQSQTEQAQLARTLLEQMTADLQGVVQPPPQVPPLPVPPLPGAGAGLDPPSGESSSSSSAGSSSSGSSPGTAAPVQPLAAATTVQPLQPRNGSDSSAPGPGSISGSVGGIGSSGVASGHPALHGEIATMSLRPAGVFGTDNYLQIDVVQPVDVEPSDEADSIFGEPLPVSLSRDEPPPSRAEELKTIVYSFDEMRDPDQPLNQAVACLVRQERAWEDAHPATRRAGRSGLSRGSAPSALADESTPGAKATEELTEEDDFADDSITRVPEVMSFSLRYYDGTTWLTEWNSAAMRRLPVAVEVSLQLRAAGEEDPYTSDEPVEPGVDFEKLVAWKHPVHRLLITLKTDAPPPPQGDPLHPDALDPEAPVSNTQDEVALGGATDAS